MGEPVDRDDDRLRKVFDAAGEALAAQDELAQRRRRPAPDARREAGNVGARRKGAVARAGEDNGANGIVLLEGAEDIEQAVDQRVVERIELCGPVERDQRQGSVPLGEDDVGRHRAGLSGRCPNRR